MRARHLTSLIVVLAVGSPTIAAADRRAVDITARLTYQDSAGPRPIAGAVVGVQRKDPGPFDIWTTIQVVHTTAQGTFRYTDTGANLPDSRYRLEVFAENDGVKVLKQDTLAVFARLVGEPGAVVELRRDDPEVRFEFNFAEAYAARHFNVAEAIREAHGFVMAHRAAGETDAPGQVIVYPHQGVSDADWYTGTFYNGTRIELAHPGMMLDHLIVHEYAHHVERTIGSFYLYASEHDGCTIKSPDSVSKVNVAWMEGFADYLVDAVVRAGGRLDGPEVGTAPASALETPVCANAPANEGEWLVAAALRDLADTSADVAEDVMCGNDDQIMAIMDRDLDHDFPTFVAFADAWRARGNDYPLAVRLFRKLGLDPPRPPVLPGFDLGLPADLAVYQAPRGSPDGVWMIRDDRGGALTTVREGSGDAVPVPADYDGDGIADLALWYPTTATWKVARSGSTPETLQFGQPGDRPAPGDYDGDGEVDYAVVDAAGDLRIHADQCGADRVVRLGRPGWLPAIADYDGDGRDDAALYDPATGAIVGLTSPSPRSGGERIELRVAPRGVPVPGRYNGDLLADGAVFVPGALRGRTAVPGRYIVTSPVTGISNVELGRVGDLPAPADYDGDGQLDRAVWRPATGETIAITWSGAPVARALPRIGGPGAIPVPRSSRVPR